MISNFHTHTTPEEENVRKLVSVKEDFPVSSLPEIYSAEYHPWYIKENSDIIFNEEFLQNASAIGEIGLDANKGPALDIQLKYFNKLLSIAQDLNKPVVIHSAGYAGELFNSLSKYPSLKVLIHGFIGKATRLEEFRKRGYYISLNPLALSKYNLSEYLKNSGIHKIGFETDDRNDISIKEIINEASILLNIPDLQEITNQTFDEFTDGKYR